MAVDCNCITKWLIMVVSGLLAAAYVYRLYLVFVKNEVKVHGTIDIVFMVIGLVLCVLCCVGALCENATLSCIAFGFLVFHLVAVIWLLVSCFIRDKEEQCYTGGYIIMGVIIAVICILLFCVYTFIQSIRN